MNPNIMRELEIALAKAEAVKERLSQRPPGPTLMRMLIGELDDVTGIIRSTMERIHEEGDAT